MGKRRPTNKGNFRNKIKTGAYWGQGTYTVNKDVLSEYQDRIHSLERSIPITLSHDTSPQRHAAQDRVRMFKDLDKEALLIGIWQGAFRQGADKFNYIKVRDGKITWLRLYFSGNRYVFVEKTLHDALRASIVYTDRDQAYKAYYDDRISWIQVLRMKDRATVPG